MDIFLLGVPEPVLQTSRVLILDVNARTHAPWPMEHLQIVFGNTRRSIGSRSQEPGSVTVLGS